MKIVSKHIEHVLLKEGKCNFLYVKNNSIEFELKLQLRNWVLNKLEEDDLFYLMIGGRQISCKEVEVLELYGGSLEQVSSKLLQQWLKYKIQNDVLQFERLKELQISFEKFCLETSFLVGDFEIELFLPEQIIDPLLKMCTFEVTNNLRDSSLSNVKLAYELWKEIIFTNKQKLIIYYHPENDGIDGEMLKFLKSLEVQGITTICFTKSDAIFKQFPYDQTNLIKDNGSIYEIEELLNQMIEFYGKDCMNHTDMMELAYRDFMEQFNLLDEKYKRFLLSSRF